MKTALPNWKTLARLRSAFLGERPLGVSDYWQSLADLADYDATFAERIGWKWNAMLEELSERDVLGTQKVPVLADWGCGSGVATRRVLAMLGVERFERVLLSDRSAFAMSFASTRLQEEFPGLRVERWNGRSPLPSGAWLLVSHVLTEIDEATLADLMQVVAGCATCLWVEPGTPAAAHRLAGVRNLLVAREGFEVLGPCLHGQMCSLTSSGQTRHWCHSLAKPSHEIFHDPFWSEFSRRLSIDLRSLPVSYLALTKNGELTRARALSEGSARTVGPVRAYKGYSKALTCDGVRGVVEVTIRKRSHSALLKRLDKDAFSHVISGEDMVALTESDELHGRVD